jgi:hypothetical protein
MKAVAGDQGNVLALPECEEQTGDTQLGDLEKHFIA